MFSRRTLVILSVALVATLAAGTAYAFSAGNTSDRAARPTPRIQEDLSPDDAQDDGGPVDKAALIADAFGASPDAVSALHEQGIGWGALFKLYAFARVKGVSVDALIAAATTDANGEKGFAFGEMKKALTTEELAVLDDGPKNFGQLVSGPHKKGHAATP